MQVRVSDVNDTLEEGYDSSRDEVSSVSSYNPAKDNLHKGFGSSASLRSSSARSLSRDPLEGSRMSLSSQMALPRLSVAEVLHDSAAGKLYKYLQINVIETCSFLFVGLVLKHSETVASLYN